MCKECPCSENVNQETPEVGTPIVKPDNNHWQYLNKFYGNRKKFHVAFGKPFGFGITRGITGTLYSLFGIHIMVRRDVTEPVFNAEIEVLLARFHTYYNTKNSLDEVLATHKIEELCLKVMNLDTALAGAKNDADKYANALLKKQDEVNLLQIAMISRDEGILQRDEIIEVMKDKVDTLVQTIEDLKNRKSVMKKKTEARKKPLKKKR